MAGIVCEPTNIVLRKKDGKVIVEYKDKEFSFLTDLGLDIPEMVRFKDRLCLVTDALEPSEVSAAVEIVESIETIKAGHDIELAGTDFKMWYIETMRECSNTISRYSTITWPTDIKNIQAVDSCRNAYEDGIGIGLDVIDSSEIKSPFESAVVADYCEKGCELGQDITLYEVYSQDKGWPTGRYARITGLNSINAELKKKAIEITDKMIRGQNISLGEAIGTAGDKITFIIGHKSMPENSLTIWPPGLPFKTDWKAAEKLICELPHLAYDKYNGQNCANTKKVLEEGCAEHSPLTSPIISLSNLIGRVSKLKNDEKGHMPFKFAENEVLIGFGQNQNEIERTFPHPNIAKPVKCGNKGCLCVCEATGIYFTTSDCDESPCLTFDDNAFQPLFISGGKDYKDGTLIKEDGALREIYFERRAKTLGICTEMPCITAS